MGGLRLIAAFGWLLACGAAAAALTGAVALAGDDRESGPAFLMSAGVMAFVAATLILGFRGRGSAPRRRHGLALMLAAWVVLPAFAALPIVATTGVSPATGYFEAVSAFTTTGATGFIIIDSLPRGLVLWRAVLEWLGGALTVLLAAAAFDVSRATGQGGIHLLSAGVASTTRLTAIARSILPLYAAATAVCLAALALAGLPGFDAVCLALSTLSTGGAMPRDGDISGYGTPAAAVVMAVFMIVGATSFMAIVTLRSRSASLQASFRGMSGALVVAGVVTVLLALIFAADITGRGGTAGEAALEAAFTMASLVSTSGFVHDADIAAVPLALVMGLVLIGGAYGSTAGGMKIGRVTRMADAASRELDILVHPSSVAPGGRVGQRLSEPQRILWSYFIAYLVAVALTASVLAGAGLGFSSALAGAAGAIANAGPAIGFLADIKSTGVVYAGLDDGVKTVLAFTMILGRVEILAVLSLATPLFWRR